MSIHNEHNHSLRRYLLGDSSAEELEQIEQLLISDDRAYQELLNAEDDLIDEYVFDALPQEDQTKFKQRFLAAPQLRQNVQFTAALRQHALETKPQVSYEPATPRLALFDWLRKFFMQHAFAVTVAAVAIVAMAVNAWLFRQNSQLRGRVAQLEARPNGPGTDLAEQLAAARQRNEQLSGELVRQQQLLAEESRKLQIAQAQQPSPTPHTIATHVVAVTLTSGFVRDSGTWTKVSLKPDVREVNIQLDVAAGDYQNYEVVLQTVEGDQKWSKKGLQFISGKFVQFNIPANVLGTNDYRVILNGVSSSGARSEIGNYYFRVSK